MVHVSPPRNSAQASVKKAKESSLLVRGAQLFNSMPRFLRDIQYGTVENFETELDQWLATIPDQPTIPGSYTVLTAMLKSTPVR